MALYPQVACEEDFGNRQPVSPRPLRRVHHHAQGRRPSSRVTSLAGAPDPAITRAAPFWRIPVAPF